MYGIQILLGDTVTVEIALFLSSARIVLWAK
jgi:hypothetical protein